MRTKDTALLLTVLALFTLCACAARKEEELPDPPPDLTGDWVQPSDDAWYHFATISEDTIEIWWYIPERNIKELYWSGSFTPPTDANEPYRWESVNNYTEEEMNAVYRFHRASREPVKTFTYWNGVIRYNVTAGHLRLGYTIERVGTIEQNADTN